METRPQFRPEVAPAVTSLRSRIFGSSTKTLLVPFLLFSLTFLVRAVYLFLVADPEPGSDYVNQYSPMAANVLQGHGFAFVEGQPTYKLVPLYPLFLAGLYGVFGLEVNVRLVLALVDGASAVLTFLIARKVFDQRVALLAGLAFAFYPPLVHLVSFGNADEVFIALHLAFALSLVKFFARPSWGSGALSGVLLGLAGLTKPVIILLPLLLLAAFLLYSRRRFMARDWARLGVLLAAFVLTISPWSIRNYLVFDEIFVLDVGRPTLGDRLFLGTLDSQLAGSAEGERWGVLADERQQAIEGESGTTPGNKQEEGSALTRAVVSRILNEPLDYLSLLPKKFLRFWYASDSGQFDRALMVAQGAVVVSGALGALLFLRREGWRRGFPLFVPLLYYPAIHTLSFPLARYSMPILPLVMMFALYGALIVGGYLRGMVSKAVPDLES